HAAGVAAPVPRRGRRPQASAPPGPGDDDGGAPRVRGAAVMLPPPGAELPSSGLAEDPVHLGAADRAGALRHPATGLADLDLAVEVTLLLALHAVAVVALSHGESPRSRGCLGVRAGRRCASTLPGRASTDDVGGPGSCLRGRSQLGR